MKFDSCVGRKVLFFSLDIFVAQFQIARVLGQERILVVFVWCACAVVRSPLGSLRTGVLWGTGEPWSSRTAVIANQ